METSTHVSDPPPKSPQNVKLEVASAAVNDVGKGVARLSFETMRALDMTAGDVVELHGKRSTVATALPLYRSDEGRPIVRIDGLQRHNAGVGISDFVMGKKAHSRPATRVVLAPAQMNVRLSGSGAGLVRTLLNRPLKPGMIVSTSVYRPLPEPDEAAFPNNVLGHLMQQRSYGLSEIRLVVVSTTPGNVVTVTPATEIELRPEYDDPEAPGGPDATYDDVGGLGDAVEQIREMIELPLKHPELFHRLGIDPPKGVLLHGPPGTGKTLLARAVANECDAQFFIINGPEILGKHLGESEERLRTVFEDAQEDSPSVIFIDEIDSIGPKRSEVPSETERRLVAQLLTLMDGLKPRENVVVIGATNRPDALDEALRRPGRFDRELVVGVPDREGRQQILQIHTRGMPLADCVDLQELARVTHGFVGADLGALCREAALESLRRLLPDMDLSTPEITADVLERLVVTHADFEQGGKRVQPTALREIMIESPQVAWDQIGGLDEVKQSLMEGVELPLTHPEAFKRLGIRPAKGVLLYGPPGTGKTLLAKAVAREAEANFLLARSSDLLSKWYGESEQQVARLFQRARQVAPAVIFIDEIDSLAPRRGGGIGEPAATERVVNTMLAEMDGLEELTGVVVVGATNQPTLLDPALLRPGRFDELIYVPVPGEEGRLKILQIHTRDMPVAVDVDLPDLARRTEGFTGADLEDLVRRAGLLALRHDIAVTDVPLAIFEQALKETGPSVTKQMDAEYRRMRAELRSEGPQPRPIGFGVRDE